MILSPDCSRTALRRLTALGAVAFFIIACSDGGSHRPLDAGSDTGFDAPLDRPADQMGPSVPVCGWAPDATELALPESDVAGVLRGPSRNAGATCTGAKVLGGPEGIYVLRVAERRVIDLETQSSLDTVIAIRRACADPLSEVACADASGANLATPSSDAGAAAAGDAGDAGDMSATGDARLRTVLDPGTYFVIIDEGAASDVGGPFVLKVRSWLPPEASTCVSAVPVVDGTTLVNEELARAGETSAGCFGVARSPALYYAALVPAGQILTVRAQAIVGTGAWTPQIQVLSACTQTMCLAGDTLSTDGERVARYTNESIVDQTVYVSVGASVPTSGARVSLNFGIGEPIANLRCEMARPLADGQVVRHQNLQEGLLQPNTCASGQQKSLFYRVRLLPTQTAHFTLAGRGIRDNELRLSVRSNCSLPPPCRDITAPTRYTNETSAAADYVVEVSHSPHASPASFDLGMTLSLPSGGVRVVSEEGMTTTEKGGVTFFDVLLTTPAVEPVTIAVASDDPQEGIASPSALIFTKDDWDKPQRVTVTGIDDAERDGDRSYIIKVLPAVSTDPRYAGVDGADVHVVNHDNEPGLRVVAPAILYTTEAGLSSSFTVVLHGPPSAAVRVPLASSDVTESTVTPSELLFDANNWNLPQAVTLKGVDDAEADGQQSFRVDVGPSVSVDGSYGGLSVVPRNGRNADDDFGVVAPHPINGPYDCSNGTAAIDQGGIIYVAMSCASGALVPPEPGSVDAGGAGTLRSTEGRVAVSVDGGRSFTSPMVAGNQGIVRVLGGRPGHAVLITRDVDDYFLVRTNDAGVTWEPPRHLYRGPGPQFFAAFGDDLRIGTNSEVARPRIWSSRDGGRTTALLPMPWLRVLTGLFVDEDGVTWTAGAGDGEWVVRSTRDGVTFDAGISIPEVREVAVGPTSVFSALDDRSLDVTPFKPGGLARTASGLLPRALYVRRRLVPTPEDGLVVIEPQTTELPPQPVMQLRWLAPGASAFGPPLSLGATSLDVAILSANAAFVITEGFSRGPLYARVVVRE